MVCQADDSCCIIALLRPNKFNTRLDLKALYTYPVDSNTNQSKEFSGYLTEDKYLCKIYGKTNSNTPVKLDVSIINKYFRYNTQTKQFVEILGVKGITRNVDAISIW